MGPAAVAKRFVEKCEEKKTEKRDKGGDQGRWKELQIKLADIEKQTATSNDGQVPQLK